MPSEPLLDLLRQDFDSLAARLERDRFPDRVLFKLSAKSRARQGVVFFAGGLGAAFAVSQFTGVVDALSVHLADTSISANPVMVDISQVAATILLAGALAATALVLRQEV